MKKIWSTVLALLLALTTLVVCTGSASAASAAADSAAVADGVNALNWKLYDAMIGENNTFYSAYSIESAFAMMDAGAKGRTKKQMEKVLGIKDIDKFLKQYQAYISQKQSGVSTLKTANGIWMNTNKISMDSVNPTYVSNMKKYMGATVKAEPFTNATSGEITGFVNKATDGYMSDYKSIIKPTYTMDLLNCIYFDGKWEEPFDPKNTTSKEFFGKDRMFRVNTMRLNNKYFQYYDNGKFNALNLPYKDSNYVMTLVLPDGGTEDKSVAEQWRSTSHADRDKFLKALDGAGYEKINTLSLPRFHQDITESGLPGIMKKLGMTDSFIGGVADFSGIAKDLYIDNVNHRAKIDVDEQGTKAAAVTEIGVMTTSMAPQPQRIINFICNHPYLYFIRDTSNGMVLFTGVMNTMKK